ncbi:alpha-galactosidase [Lactobacillus gasseri]|uniref:Alpha-galactosidase n=1 Tax=Lactobacillus gasseri SV-16A-US TaxID=575604 RepID=A0AB34NYD6_LACGS|nr:alpha-galactosidase [Lactobacillus gasseri]KFL96804.1 alpha-galactosidase [Lactobacillus gasseri SV-16A-US]MCZ3947542.1 alpha-galactosidase [Lactobacillus gasseri]QTH65676.1 alpha-galactosidase [Lactobacillus gasseri]RGL17998.1 alpha-galactosidase [Lactobacillus gasseri]
MIDVIDNKYFYLHNGAVAYLFGLLSNHQLEHLYYGEDLGELSKNDLEYMSLHPNKASGTVKYSKKIKNFTLADRMQEFPTYGTSDFREGAVSIENEGAYLYPDFKYDHFEITTGKKRNLDFPTSYGNDSENLIVSLIDTDHQLELQLSYSIFENLSAIVRKATIINHGKQEVKLTNLQSTVLDLPNDSYDFLQLSGAWTKERHITTRPLTQGITKIESLRGASSHQENPFIALVDKNVTNDSGNIYASNLIYSGNFISQVEVDEWGQSRLMTGINPATFKWKLAPNQDFSTPEAVLFYSKQGFNGLMKQTHNFVKKHIIDQKWQQRDRLIVINNWEATYFDFNEEKLLKLAAQANQLGIECFVLDDGWFGKRDSDNSSLGNWTVDKRKFPQGLDHFSAQVHKMGMKFGLWFEPEMVSADTELYNMHPDWVVRHPYKRYSVGRRQYVLDFANPAVVDNIYQQMAKIIEDAQVDYIKWDMNRNITEAYSPYLYSINHPQGEFFHRYIQGVYKLYAKLLTSFPDLLIEGCASGGGRFDLGILYYSPQIWPSDDSDAVERLDIMSGTLLAYPLSTFSNHVSAVPNDQVKRITSLKFRQNVACFGPLGYELDLNKLSTEEKNQIKNWIRWYKENRKLLVNGTFDQLLKFDPSQNTYAWSVSNSNKQIVGFYRKLARPNETLDQYLPLKHLNDHQKYQINFDQMVSGRVLQKFGLREPYQFNASNPDTAQISGDFQSYLYQIKTIDRKI